MAGAALEVILAALLLAPGFAFASASLPPIDDAVLAPDSRPLVIGTAPANRTHGVGIDANVTVLFDQPMDAAATVNAFNITPPVGNSSFVGGQVLTFNHTAPFSQNTTYSVVVNKSARNAIGEEMLADHRFWFSTGQEPPTVTGSDPPAGTVEVPLDSALSIDFSLPMDPNSTASAFSVSPLVNGTNLTVTGSQLTFRHSTPFTENTTYNVSVSTGAKSTAGEPLAGPYSFNFTTAAPPAITSTVPAKGSVAVPVSSPVIVRFDRPMNASTTSAAFTILPPVNGTPNLSGANLTWTHATPLATSTNYTFVIGPNATSAAGARLGAEFRSWFVTAAPPPSTVAITDPPGFQLWRTNELHNISWFSTDVSPAALVDLSYTAFGGAPVPIASDLAPSGTYAWTVGLTAIGSLTIRADLRDPLQVANATVGVLVIPPFLVTIAPTAATLDMGSRQMFQATAVSTTGQPIPQEQVAFFWQLSNTTVASVDPPLARFTNLTGLAVGTTSLTCLALYQGAGSTGLPAQVTVVAPPPPTVAVLAPAGGDAFDSDSPIEIRWRANASIFPLTVDVDYSLDGGGNFTRVASGISQPSAGIKGISWDPPVGVETERAVVRVTAVDPAASSGSDESSEFAIRTPVELRAYSPLELAGVVDRLADGPAIVQAVSRGGRPVPGIAISWSLLSQPQPNTTFTFNSSDLVTDGSGLASARLHLGGIKGDYIVQAEANGTTMLPVVFTARARPGPPSSVFIEPAQATVNRGSTQRFKVTAYDAFSNLIEDPIAAWSVVGGIGSVDTAGLFAGERPGSGEVVATLEGESGPVTARAQVLVVEPGISAGALSIVLLALLIPLILLLLLFRKRIVRMVTGRTSGPKVIESEAAPSRDSKKGTSGSWGNETEAKRPAKPIRSEKPRPKLIPGSDPGVAGSGSKAPAATANRAARQGGSTKGK